ncbi:VOC family protein [Jannaschia sp. M317]|uniref:VOC family protein n=1 Tax=Jannaschia sp. M317 TaxID=2867011 RepID=UPI0021A2E26C|nr:VOC family protein [Jannaschia sp. M317]UWQ17850.1 VOC family protein [Jannaschia sp. M317]
MKVRAFDHMVLTVADPQATSDWYARVLGMEPISFEAVDGTTRLALKFGSWKINLHKAGAEYSPHATRPAPGSADLCFLIDADLGDFAVMLLSEGIEIEEGPVPRTGATGPITSMYLRDPDGNLLEVSVPDAMGGGAAP